MAGANLETTFGVRTLTGVVQKFANEKIGFVSDLFRKGRQVNPEGRTFDWDLVTAQRSLAPVTGSSSSFINTKQTTKANKQSALAHIKLYVDITGDKLFYDRAPGSLRPNAAQTVAIELANMQRKIQRTIEKMCVDTLNGDLNVTTAAYPGSEFTFRVQYTGDEAITSHTATAAWSTAGTAIISSEIPALQAAYMQSCGLEPSIALINDVTERSFLGNTEIKDWAKQMFGAQFLTSNSLQAAVVNGMRFGGLEWRKSPAGYKAGVDGDGSWTRYLTDATAIVLPAESELGDVLGMAEGYGIIPRSAFGAEWSHHDGSAAGDGLISLAPSAGWYAYSTVQENPAGIRLYCGWTGLPFLTNPLAVMLADLTP